MRNATWQMPIAPAKAREGAEVGGRDAPERAFHPTGSGATFPPQTRTATRSSGSGT